MPPAERTICCRGRRSAAARSAGARQRLATGYGAAAGHARPVSDANAGTVSAAALAWPVNDNPRVLRREGAGPSPLSGSHGEGPLPRERHAPRGGPPPVLLSPPPP